MEVLLELELRNLGIPPPQKMLTFTSLLSFSWFQNSRDQRMAKIMKAAQMRSPSKASEPELDWEDQTPGDSKVGCTGSLGQRAWCRAHPWNLFGLLMTPHPCMKILEQELRTSEVLLSFFLCFIGNLKLSGNRTARCQQTQKGICSSWNKRMKGREQNGTKEELGASERFERNSIAPSGELAEKLIKGIRKPKVIMELKKRGIYSICKKKKNAQERT